MKHLYLWLVRFRAWLRYEQLHDLQQSYFRDLSQIASALEQARADFEAADRLFQQEALKRTVKAIRKAKA